MQILCNASAFQQRVDESWICSLRSRMQTGYWAIHNIEEFQNITEKGPEKV